MVLPVVSIAVAQIAVYMRLLRTDMVATLQEDFILMAKSKGISNRRVLWRHALRPSSITLLTVAGLQVGVLIGSTLVIEQLFFIPGMGLADRRGALHPPVPGPPERRGGGGGRLRAGELRPRLHLHDRRSPHPGQEVTNVTHVIVDPREIDIEPESGAGETPEVADRSKGLGIGGWLAVVLAGGHHRGVLRRLLPAVRGRPVRQRGRHRPQGRRSNPTTSSAAMSSAGTCWPAPSTAGSTPWP